MEQAYDIDKLVRIEYGPAKLFMGQNMQALATAIADPAEAIKDKTLWQFHVDGNTQPWMFIDGSLATVRRMCDRVLRQNCSKNKPSRPYKLHDRPKVHYQNTFGGSYRFASIQMGHCSAEQLDLFETPDPARLLVEVFLGADPNRTPMWGALYYNQITKEFTREISPNCTDMGTLLTQWWGQIHKQCKIIINPIEPVVPALG